MITLDITSSPLNGDRFYLRNPARQQYDRSEIYMRINSAFAILECKIEGAEQMLAAGTRYRKMKLVIFSDLSVLTKELCHFI